MARAEASKEYLSRPARALWIEIYRNPYCALKVTVEAREGLVD